MLSIPSWAFSEMAPETDPAPVDGSLYNSATQKSYDAKPLPENKIPHALCNKALTLIQANPLDHKAQQTAAPTPLAAYSTLASKQTKEANASSSAYTLDRKENEGKQQIKASAPSSHHAKPLQQTASYKASLTAHINKQTKSTESPRHLKSKQESSAILDPYPSKLMKPQANIDRPLWFENSQEQDHEGQHRQNSHTQAQEEVTPTTSTPSFTKHRFIHQKTSLDRPCLEPPRIGVYALYYILTKIGIISDATSHWEAKQTIEANDAESTELHNKRLAELKKAVASEKSSKRWSASVQIFSWLNSFLSMIAGVALIITGVAAVAGALLVAGGALALTNQILETTGAWQKIADKLPGDNPEKKQAIIAWMQIGIAVLCLILSGAGIIFGGFSAFGSASQSFMQVFGGVVLIASSVSTIGQGVTQSDYFDFTAKGKEHSRHLTALKYRRQDLMESVEAGISRMKQLFEDMARILDFEAELFRSEQAIIR